MAQPSSPPGLTTWIFHFSYPITSKRNQHLTLTCVDSTLVSSQSLTCTDLLSCSWPMGGTNYLVWYQKNLSRGKPNYFRGNVTETTTLSWFITTSYTCSQTSNIQRSTQRYVPEHVSLRVGAQHDPQQSKQACVYYSRSLQLFGIQITRFKFRCALFRRGSEVLGCGRGSRRDLRYKATPSHCN